MVDDDGNHERLNRDAWIDEAYRLFAEGGPKAVRVDMLAQRLNITRGSFYWHFKNRADLLNAILKHWVRDQTDAVIAENEAQGGDAAARLRRLLGVCASDDGRIELGVRAWAKEDAAAQKTLQSVDDARIRYLATLLHALGHDDVSSRKHAEIAYLAWLGLYARSNAQEEPERIRQMNALCDLLIPLGQG